MKLGIQVYSVRNEASEDFEGTLRRLRDMGYEGVEFAGLYGFSFEKTASFLEKYGLEAVSAHITPQDVESDEIMDGYRSIGLKYAAVQGFGLKQEQGAIDWCANRAAELGKRAKAYGISLLYHNHRYEFNQLNGRYLLDLMYNAVPRELLQTEVDVCWASVCGVDPAQYLAKYQGRCPVVHLKDYRGAFGTDSFEMMSVGSGVLDIPSILNACKNVGTEWIIVEQDSPSRGKTPLACAEESAAFLKDTVSRI